MVRSLIAFSAAVGFVFAAGSTTRWNDADLHIHTSSGSVTGIIDKKNPNVRQFLGIPYAQAPVGELRWNPPVRLPETASRQKIQATRLPASCPQTLSTRGNSIYNLEVLEFNLQGLNTTGAISEDCLSVSVWTPKTIKQKQLLPVLIYIYGGAFVNGGIDVPYQNPTQWVQRTQRHIVVSFNYRLNIFGFPNAKGLKHQNVGLLDQRLAVEWIQQNIRAFGGDPDKLTLWGQSAGAQSVDFYNYAYYEDPIVRGLIMDSGTALLPILSKDKAQSNFTSVAAHFNCASTDTTQQLACMREIPFHQISTYLQQYADNGTSPGLTFAPIADEKVVFSNYTARAELGLQSNLPAIIGTNAQDGIITVPYPVSDTDAGIDATAAYLGGLNLFGCPAAIITQLRQETGLTTFRYFYNGNFSNIAPRFWQGAYHSAELPLLFGTYGSYRGPATELEEKTSIAMQDAWVAFARDGMAGVEKTGWKQYKIGQDTVREFGAGVAVQDYSILQMEKDCGISV